MAEQAAAVQRALDAKQREQIDRPATKLTHW
jgi:hypothetical protein